MAEHTHAGPAEVGAPMDYAAHERMYAGFIAMLKIGVLASINTVLALVLFGFGRGGFWLGSVLLLLMVIATVISVIAKGNVKALGVVAAIGILFLALSVT